ncbi:MAG: hydrolase [Methanomassiliicoccus sp.]|nr:hydrolase [Methanomassiliicoccus sp.]
MTALEPGSDIGKYKLRKDDIQILIIDVQERLVAAMPERERVVANVSHLLALSTLFSVPVVVTEQYPRGLGPTIPEVASAISPMDPLEKLTFSCLDHCEVPQRLTASGRRTVVVVGMEAHVCVLQTCLDLLTAGYNVHVVRDAVCSRSAEDKANALDLLRDAGAVVTTTETVLFQVLGKAGTDEFKAISRRVK